MDTLAISKADKVIKDNSVHGLGVCMHGTLGVCMHGTLGVCMHGTLGVCMHGTLGVCWYTGRYMFAYMTCVLLIKNWTLRRFGHAKVGVNPKHPVGNHLLIAGVHM